MEQEKKDEAVKRAVGRFYSQWWARCFEQDCFKNREPPEPEEVMKFKEGKKRSFKAYTNRDPHDELELYGWHYPHLLSQLGGIVSSISCDKSLTEQQALASLHARKDTSFTHIAASASQMMRCKCAGVAR